MPLTSDRSRGATSDSRLWAMTLACCLTCILPLHLARAADKPVTRVEFRNSAQKTLRHWPVAVSIPVPRELVSGAPRFHLVQNGGQAVPTSVQVLARGNDRLPQWVRLYGQVDLAPGSTTRLNVHRGPDDVASAGRVTGAVEIRELRDRVEVQNGTLHFVLRRQSELWIDSLSWDKHKSGAVSLRGEARVDGLSVGASPKESIKVLDSGPVRGLIEIQGRYGKSPLRYRLRIESFANQPAIRVQHTFEVHADTNVVRLAHLGVEVRLPKMHKPRAAYRLEGAPNPIESPIPLTVAQHDNASYAIGSNRRPGQLAGWFDVHDGKFGMTLWARWFWQQYPQAVRVQGQTLRYDFYGGTERPALAGTGAAKTHEFVLALRSTGAAPGVEELSQLPLLGQVDPQWLLETGALRAAKIVQTQAGREFLRRLSDAWPRVQRSYETEEWDDRQEVQCPQGNQPDPLEVRRRGFYGMWNWGDWNYPKYHDTTKGCDAWGNLEYDLTQVLALAYWLTGNARFYDPLVAAGQHFMDVDIIHYQPTYPQWVGMNHPKNPLHWSFELGGPDLGHTWTEGLLSLYLLSGDDRALAAARGIGEFLLRRVRAPLKGNPRQFGWPQTALVALYELTNDARYLEGAKKYAELGMERHQPDKVQDWKLGILAEGLTDTHRHTADEKIWEWLKHYAHRVASLSTTTDVRLWPAVAYVASLQRDKELAGRAKAVVDRLDFGGWAKPFTIAGRVGFAILSNLGTLADAPLAPAPGAVSTPRDTSAPHNL